MGLRPDPKIMSQYLAYSQIGFEMVGPILLGLLLDHWLESAPTCVTIGAILGLVGGMAHLIHMVRKSQQKDSSQSQQDIQ